MRELLFEWQDLWTPEYKERSIDYSMLSGGVRKVILFTGCRRVGKTYMMFQVIDHYKKEMKIDRNDIVYINFEDERIERAKTTLTSFLPLLIELYGERDFHLFLDEIHHIPDWSRWVRRIYDRFKNIHIYLSSSSSKLSNKEIPGTMRGRTIGYEVFPLSFIEFLSFHDYDLTDPKHLSEVKKARIFGYLNEYLTYGGFPEVVLEKDIRKKRTIVQDYFKTIIALDICERYNVKNHTLMHNYIKLLLNSPFFSINKIYNTLRSLGIKVGKDTIIRYSQYVEDIYFSYFIPIFSYKIKDRMQYQRKVYFIDNAFISQISTQFSDNKGRLMENLVGLELIKKYGKENIFYWHDRSGNEVDFVIVEGLVVLKLIQVCYDIFSKDTKKREIKSLIKCADEIKCSNLIVINKDIKNMEKINDHTIQFVPLYSWLLGIDSL